ncbi:MAG: PaaI family thioesterase [Candidatus Dormibacterales bacterium]
MTNLEALRRGMEVTGPRAGWRELIGARLAEVAKGRVVVELEAQGRHRHEGGVVQGGIITAVADAAMGMTLLTVQEGELANTTVELKINFLRPVVEGRIRGVGRVVDVREPLLFAEAEVFDEQDRLVAHATSTCMSIPRRGWR